MEYILFVLSVAATIFFSRMRIDLLPPLDSSFMAFPFFYFGYRAKNYMLSEKLNLWLALISLIFWSLLVSYNGRVDVAHCSYGNNLLLFYLIAFCGSFALIQGCKLLRMGGANCWHQEHSLSWASI